MVASDGPGSVSIWIDQLKPGDDRAIASLCNRYLDKLARCAERKLKRSARGPWDGEDVALYAFDVFCRAAAAGRLTKLNNRGDLWRILVMLAGRKAAEVCRAEMRLKRGGPAKLQLSLDNLQSRESAAELRITLADQERWAIDLLPDETLREIARRTLGGESASEIADRLGILRRSVKRKMRLIYARWVRALSGNTDEQHSQS